MPTTGRSPIEPPSLPHNLPPTTPTLAVSRAVPGRILKEGGGVISLSPAPRAENRARRATYPLPPPPTTYHLLMLSLQGPQSLSPAVTLKFDPVGTPSY